MSAVEVDAYPTSEDISSAYWADVFGRLLWPMMSGIPFALLTMVGRGFDDVLQAVAVFAFMALGFSAALTAWFLLLFWWFGARRLLSLPGIVDHTSYVFGADGVEVRSERRSVKADWAFWSRAYETAKVLVLCDHSAGFFVLPKRQMEDGVLQALRSFLRAGLKGRVRFKGKQQK